jgi:AcrR family transcriptional regulator
VHGVVTHAEPRAPLSRDKVLRAAVRLADANGIEALTMRRLAEEFQAEAMSLYHHVANKEDVLDGVVDVVAAEINQAVGRVAVPAAGAEWKKALRQRILTAREVMLRHTWAPRVFESRTSTSVEVLRYYDGVVGCMRAGGFSFDTIHHAMHALGSRALGFATELFDPSGAPAEVDPAEMQMMAGLAPNLAGLMAAIVHDDPASTLGWCDDQAEFEFGLDIILDGLDRLR